MIRLGVLLAMTVFGMGAGADSMLGFSEPLAVGQRELEKEFDSYLNRELQRGWMRKLSARPHHLGSAFDRENAE